MPPCDQAPTEVPETPVPRGRPAPPRHVEDDSESAASDPLAASWRSASTRAASVPDAAARSCEGGRVGLGPGALGEHGELGAQHVGADVEEQQHQRQREEQHQQERRHHADEEIGEQQLAADAPQHARA